MNYFKAISSAIYKIIDNITDVAVKFTGYNKMLPTKNIYQENALENPNIIKALKEGYIKFDEILKITNSNQLEFLVAALENPNIIKALKEGYIKFDEILKITNSNQLEFLVASLDNPNIAKALKDGYIKFDEILKINNSKQIDTLQYVLENSGSLKALKDGTIKFDEILQIDNHYKLDYLKIPGMLDAIIRGGIKLSQFIKINNSKQIDTLQYVLENSGSLKALKDGTITLDDLLQIDDNYKLEALKTTGLLDAIIIGDIELSQFIKSTDYHPYYILRNALQDVLKDSSVMEVIKKIVITLDWLFQGDYYSKLKVLKIPIVLDAIMSGGIKLSQLLNIRSIQADALLYVLENPNSLEAFKNGIITFEDIFQIDDYNKLEALKIPGMLDAIIRGDIKSELLQINDFDKLEILNIPGVLDAIISGDIKLSQFLDINDYNQLNILQYVLENPNSLKALKSGIITSGDLFKITNSNQLQALKIPGVLDAIINGDIKLSQFTKINNYNQVDALRYVLENPNLLEVFKNGIITFEDIFQIDDQNKLKALKIPAILNAIIKGGIKLSKFIKINNHNQIDALQYASENPNLLKAFQDGIITFDDILQFDDYDKLKALKIPAILNDIISGDIKLSQFLNIKNYNQVDALQYVLENPNLLKAFKDGIITFDDILQFDDYNKLKVLKIPVILDAIIKGDMKLSKFLIIKDFNQVSIYNSIFGAIESGYIGLDKILQISSFIQVTVLLNEELTAFFTNDDGLINFELLRLVENRKQLEYIKTLIDLDLLNNKNTEHDEKKFTLDQALKFNYIHMRQLPLFVDRLATGACTTDKFTTSYLKADDFVSDISNESTMKYKVIEREVVVGELNDKYGADNNIEKDIEEMKKYFEQITKQEEKNNFTKVIILDIDAKLPDEIDNNTVVLQKNILSSGSVYVKASWMGYRGYETTLKQRDISLLIDDLPQSIKDELETVVDNKTQVEITDKDLVNDVISTFQLIKKYHIAAVKNCGERLIGDKSVVNILVNIWRDIRAKGMSKKELLDDALWVFANGLCEIQRAHNHYKKNNKEGEEIEIAEEGRFEIDDSLLSESADSKSCEIGTFNKLAEISTCVRLVFSDAIHPEQKISDDESSKQKIEIEQEAKNFRAIQEHAAGEEFRIKAQEVIEKYILDRIDEANSIDDVVEINNLMECIESGDNKFVLDIIDQNNAVKAIIDNAANSVFYKYGELLYENNRDDTGFKTLRNNLSGILSLIDIDDEPMQLFEEKRVNALKKYVLGNPNISKAIEDGSINSDEILQITDSNQLKALKIPNILDATISSGQLEALKIPGMLDAIIRGDIKYELLQIDDCDGLEALRIPGMLGAIIRGDITLYQVLEINDSNQVDALRYVLENPNLLKAFKDGIIAFDNLLQISNKYQVEALEDKSIIDAIVSRSIGFDKILQINSDIQVNILLNKKLTEFFTNDDGLINEKLTKFFTNDYGLIDFESLRLVKNEAQFESLKTLIDLNLLNKNKECDNKKFTLAQVIEFNDIHMEQMPLYVDRLTTGETSPGDFMILFSKTTDDSVYDTVDCTADDIVTDVVDEGTVKSKFT